MRAAGRAVIAAVSAALVAAAPGAGAQAARAVTLRLDNDAFNFWQLPGTRPDEEYTSGVRLTYAAGTSPWWGRRVARGLPDCAPGREACRARVLAFGQDIYTPRRTRDTIAAPEGSRPNAGWLYLEESLRILRTARSEELSITIGVTGEPALAQFTQRLAHSFAPAFNRPTDWSDQVGFEPGLIVRYEHATRLAFGGARTRGTGGGNVAFDVLPRLKAELGNVRTLIEAGVRVRTGLHLRHPWLPAPAGAPPELVLSVGAAARGVARDLLLDGKTYRGGPRVGHEPVTRSFDWSLALRRSWLVIAYGAQVDSRAYAAAPAWHAWSSMSAGVVFDR